MSERGSYDSGPGDRILPSTPVRVTKWKPEWPPQSEVPHAGERVWDKDGIPLTVVSGIPYRAGPGGSWRLDIRDGDGDVMSSRVSDLSRTPPTKRYRVALRLNIGGTISHEVDATDEADAIAKAVTVEEVS